MEILPDQVLVAEPDGDTERVFAHFDIHPIPLSRELLVGHYGFFDNGDPRQPYLHLPGICLSETFDGWQIYSTQFPTARPIRYQHELENLYAALWHRDITQSHFRPTAADKSSDWISMRFLRLGNIVLGKSVNGHKDMVINVRAIRESGVIWNEFSARHTCQGLTVFPELDLNDPQLPGWIQGVPLTAEWLIRLGFSFPQTAQHFYKLGRLDLLFSGGAATLQEGSHHFGRSFQYVHQLQNLYFALTGIDLVPSFDSKGQAV